MSREEREGRHAQSLRGYLYITAATFCWGISATLGRAAFTGRLFPLAGIGAITPLILSQFRTTFAFPIFLLILIAKRGWQGARIPRSDVGRLFLLGICGVAASNYFYYFAILRTGVATAITVQYTAPVWVLLFMVVTGSQRPTLRRILAVFLALAGIALVARLVGASGLRLDGVGIIASVLAAFSFACYNIGGHRLLARYDHWTILFYITAGASVFWLLINPPWKIAAQHYSVTAWAFLFVFSLISVLVPFSFYIGGLQYLDPTRAVIVSSLEPVFSILLTAVFLREMVYPLQALGIVLVLTAILALETPGRKSEPVALAGPVD